MCENNVSAVLLSKESWGKIRIEAAANMAPALYAADMGSISSFTYGPLNTIKTSIAVPPPKKTVVN